MASSTKKCPHCKMEIDAQASRCPHCHGKIYVWTTGRIVLAIMLGVAIFAGIVNSSTSSSTPSNSGAQQTVTDRKVTSIVFAKSVIEKLLKSPSSAKFSDVQAYELSNEKDVWAVNGYVDSENSFGASLRSTWEVQLDYRDGKGGTVKSVMFDGKQIQ